MANETATAPRGTQRETISIPVTPVDERRFDSELRRIDVTVSGEQKNREKFETRIEKAVNDLRSDMGSQFEKLEKNIDTRFEKSDAQINGLRGDMNSQFEKSEKSIDTRFEKLEKSIDTRFEKVDGAVKNLRGEVK